jgi:hypothetical protein
MKKYILLISIFLVYENIIAQTPDSILLKSEFQIEFSKLTRRINALEKSNMELNKSISNQGKQVGKIASQMVNTDANLQLIADSLHLTISDISTSNQKTENQIHVINQTIINHKYYWVLGIIAVAIISLIFFLILRKKLNSSTKNLDSQIAKANEIFHHESINLDSKLIEILQTQLRVLEQEKNSKAMSGQETEHKLPMKVGEEIHRMKKRIENMPQDIKGLSALINSIQRLEEEFNDNGYEIEELLGKKYVDGMKVEARFVDNPNIPKGEEIITNVLRPQILYKGTVIQVAKVEVGKSY